MKKTACWAVDSSPLYHRSLTYAVRRFAELNPGWRRKVFLVDDTPECHRLAGELMMEGCWVVDSHKFRTPHVPGAVLQIPTARVRVGMLCEVADDEVLAYMDADGWCLSPLGPLGPLADEVVAGDHGLALLPETDPRFNTYPMSFAFVGGTLDGASCFPGRAAWMDLPMLNSGMIVAHGRKAREVGLLAHAAYLELERRIALGEQGPIGGAVYESGLPFRPLRIWEHCNVYEGNLQHDGEPYAGRLTLDGHPVVFRHFAAPEGKPAMREALDRLGA